ncbi:hypothetical protein EVAR_98460_1 [Eumeta japonica]|uniref:Uncharacterized protein n=1 Tax=Eumeta variegata TaxID=151549 RepID=A0A4C1YTP5_EUMVA|nr:hypothetical protein EVAR_98460_1 [Eumeta japonica]
MPCPEPRRCSSAGASQAFLFKFQDNKAHLQYHADNHIRSVVTDADLQYQGGRSVKTPNRCDPNHLV